jgi:hypothetical protein
MIRMWILNRAAKFRSAAVAGTCALIACQDAAPRVRTLSNVAGEYVMVERDGKRLPHTMHVPDPPNPCDFTLIRDVLVLRPDGEYTGESESYSNCTGQPQPDTSVMDHYRGTFSLRGPRGDTIVLAELATTEIKQRGVLRGDELRVEYEVLTAPRRTVRFRYVRQNATR